MNKQVFLQRISDNIYGESVNFLRNEYHFLNGSENGGRMRLANYFVGISQSLADEFIAFIDHVVAKINNNDFPEITLPEGFSSQDENLTDLEKTNKFSFGSFDMAVTEDGLRSIEFQAIATYPFTAAKLNQFIKTKLDFPNTYIFPQNKGETWSDFISTYQSIMGGEHQEPIVLTDRNLQNQKTNFEFYATQKELGVAVEIVDIEDIFEKDKMLFYKTVTNANKKIERLYNRILPSEAIYEDHYPKDSKWTLRYDNFYQDFKFINHPRKLFEISKALLPYLDHPFNPPTLELKNVASEFFDGKLPYDDYVWKHKQGAAGFSLILSPTSTILKKLIEENTLSDYVVQRKVNYKIFKTDDGLEKIVELRFMTAHTKETTNIIPMARIGHCVKQKDGSMVYKIHFGDNNRLGYGFAPVLIFSEV